MNIIIYYNFIIKICRDTYSVTLAHETKLFKLCILQTSALKSLEIIMTNSINIDILVNPISSKLKLSTDANKNSIKENNKKKDNKKEFDGMKEILIFLFR